MIVAVDMDNDQLLIAAYPHFEQRSLLDPEAPTDPVEGLAIVADNGCARWLRFSPLR